MKLETVRPATPADLLALLELEGGSAAAAHWSEAEYHRVFAEAARTVLVIGEDAVQGFIVGRDLGPEWEIENIVVASSVQRRGLGTRLVQKLLDLARSRGAQAVFLEVRESNRAARALYSKSGFVETGRRRGYYKSPEEDALVCKKLFPQVTGKAVEGGKRV
ncbi:MAG TPA: ribosomal protein S18-alanine N-acetyltransferase [Terriglobales bacterium]|nr:ribosomal protein S18-alanine N-acetyltransferase [Terriglobales bacterium]